MSDAPGQVLSHHVPDDGRWYDQGTIVRVVRRTHIDLIPDPNGDYEVQRCERQAYLSGDPQLTVEIRKLERWWPQKRRGRSLWTGVRGAKLAQQR